LAEKSLRNGKESKAAGKKYHIVDGGKPVKIKYILLILIC